VTGEPGRQHTGVHIDYAHSVHKAGGLPLVLPPAMGPEGAAEVADDCDGLVLTGGEDLHPELYGLTGTEHVRETDPARDAHELALFRAAHQRRIPILAICRGFQLVNVALGGTLWQDLPVQRPSDLDHDTGTVWQHRAHHVNVTPGSRVYRSVGREVFLTNSFHHQAIRDLAPGLRATATADDGLIEAAEAEAETQWLVGVQWHPESFWREDGAPEFELFVALVSEARDRASGRPFELAEDSVG
jgi:putative glutamine amidotransferase